MIYIYIHILDLYYQYHNSSQDCPSPPKQKRTKLKYSLSSEKILAVLYSMYYWYYRVANGNLTGDGYMSSPIFFELKSNVAVKCHLLHSFFISR